MAAKKHAGSLASIWIIIIVILPAAASGSWFYFSKKPKAQSKLLGKLKAKPARKAC